MSAEEHDHDQVEPVSQTQPVSPAQPVSRTEQVGGAQPGRQRPRSAWLGSRRFAVLAGVITVGLLTGAGVAFATTGSPAHPATPGAATAATPAPSSSAPSSSAPSPAPSFRVPLPHRFPFRPGMIPGFAGPLGLAGPFGAIHGQYVAPKSGGGYQTIAFQNGKVTAVSGRSITLRSVDGYTHTYVVNSATTVNAQRGGISSIKTGNEAVVRATVSGSTTTAAQITDLSLLQKNIHHFFGNWPPGKNMKTAIP
jgi:hypothetical protein